MAYLKQISGILLVSEVVSCLTFLKCCVLVVDWINVSYCVEIVSNNRVKFCSKSLRGRPTLGGSVECVCHYPRLFFLPRRLASRRRPWPAAYQRLLFMLMLVMATTGAGGQDTGSSSVVRILAVFNQSEMEKMERVTHKTLIALNKEKTAWTGSSGGGRWNRLLNSGIGVIVTSSINSKKSRSKWFGVQRWPCCPFDGGQCHVLFSVLGSIRRPKISAVS